MGRPRQPVDLIVAKGKKHITKKEVKERKESEIKVDFKDVKPPDYLSDEQAEEFNGIAHMLLQIGIMTELDEDCLARYLQSKTLYLKCCEMLNDAILTSNIEEMEKLMTMQDKAFKQCRMSASDLGLTISSRCRLVLPQPIEQPKENKFDKFKK